MKKKNIFTIPQTVYEIKKSFNGHAQYKYFEFPTGKFASVNSLKEAGFTDRMIRNLIEDEMIMLNQHAKEFITISDLKDWHNHSNDSQKIELKNSEYILDNSELPQMIDQALGLIEINNTKMRYFGAKLSKNEITKNRHGETIQVTKQIPVIILENGEIVDENSKKVSFKFKTVMSLAQNRWSLQSIKNYTQGQSSSVNIKTAYQEIRKIYQNSMVYESDTWYKFDALWDLLTYLQDLIDKTLIVKHEGQSGSAKSKGLKICANVSFNGRKWLKPTAANFFRYRNKNKATICIEEAERLFDDNSKHDSSDKELVEFLNASYEKGNYVPRQNDKDLNLTDEFDPFGCTRIGAIKPLKGATQKRSITHLMVTAPPKDKRGDVEIGTESDIEFQNVRDLCYIAVLSEYKTFQKNLSNIKNNFGLANRQWQQARPLLALAKCISDPLTQEIGDFIANQFDIRDEKSDSRSWEFIISGILMDQTCNSKAPIFFSNGEVQTKFNLAIGKDLSTTAVTHQVNKLGFRDFNGHNSDKTKRGWTLDFEKVCEISWRNKIIDLQQTLKKVSEVSNCPYSVDKIKEMYADTLGTLQEKKRDLSSFTDTSDGQDTKSGGYDVVSIIQKLDSGAGVSVEFLASKLGLADPSSLDFALSKLATAGDVFECRPGVWKVLE